ncbi:MAG: hypothetical protein AAGB26_07890 [Planctomycetota bacterium]
MPRPLSWVIKLVFTLVLIGGVYVLFIHEDRVVLPPGVRVPDEPVQVNIDPLVVYQDGENWVTALAEFSMQAKVLGRERYRNDTPAELSPIDLALGWQRMSDQRVVDQISISQRGRWYHWRTRNAPIPLREIEQCSANFHMLPANGRVREALLAVRTGEIIAFTGYLVDAQIGEDWLWETPMTRDDTGDGACEIVWVQTFEVVETE